MHSAGCLPCWELLPEHTSSLQGRVCVHKCTGTDVHPHPRLVHTSAVSSLLIIAHLTLCASGHTGSPGANPSSPLFQGHVYQPRQRPHRKGGSAGAPLLHFVHPLVLGGASQDPTLAGHREQAPPSWPLSSVPPPEATKVLLPSPFWLDADPLSPNQWLVLSAILLHLFSLEMCPEGGI